MSSCVLPQVRAAERTALWGPSPTLSLMLCGTLTIPMNDYRPHTGIPNVPAHWSTCLTRLTSRPACLSRCASRTSCRLAALRCEWTSDPQQDHQSRLCSSTTAPGVYNSTTAERCSLETLQPHHVGSKLAVQVGG